MGAGFRVALRIIGIQLGLALVAALLAYAVSDLRAALSAGIGGLISAVSTAFFALRVFAAGADAPLRKVVRAFYAGEAQKLLLTAALFFAAIKWGNVAFLPLILSYSVSLLVYWIVLPYSLTETS
jgi:ATP synthase protein I